MGQPPETRESLLVRVRDASDQEAWYEFAEVYRPVIYRLARAKGMQHADAEDLAQQVLLSVAGAIGRWESDPARARFRTWLRRVAHNAIINALTRGAPDRAAGGFNALTEQPAPEGPDSDLLRTEYRREIFRWAARQIKDEFQPDTWDAFWWTAVDGRDVAEVARALGKNTGAVYAAKSRVMRRLREKIGQFEET
jgi:RNA polymerase sigma-70 factor (ECF subfamily)